MHRQPRIAGTATIDPLSFGSACRGCWQSRGFSTPDAIVDVTAHGPRERDVRHVAAAPAAVSSHAKKNPFLGKTSSLPLLLLLPMRKRTRGPLAIAMSWRGTTSEARV